MGAFAIRHLEKEQATVRKNVTDKRMLDVKHSGWIRR